MSAKSIRSFTLLELLIAAAIFSLVLLSIYSAFQAGIFSANRIDAAFRTYQAARSFGYHIEADLKNASAYLEGDSGFQGNKDQLAFFTVIDSFEQGNSAIAFVRVKYIFDNEGLKRFFYSGLDAFDANAQGKMINYEAEEVTFSYASATNDPVQPYEWQPAWPKDVTQKAILPVAVKVKLVLAQKDSRIKSGKEKVEFNKFIPISVTENSLSLALPVPPATEGAGGEIVE